jgi:phage/plasmid-like protein (TIGR03299 family)
MAHGITEKDTMFSVREMPWHGLGTVLDEYPGSIKEALDLSGLDWSVVQRPVHIPMTTMVGDQEITTYPQAEGIWANVREDTNDVLGVVTDRYKPIQNHEAFAFMDNLIGSQFDFETAGSLQAGKKVWVLARIPDHVEVGGDEISQYVFISNTHDGKASCIVAATPIRIVCANTLGWALGNAKRGGRSYTVRHTGNINAKLHEARNVMEMTINYYEQFKKFGDQMALESISQSALETRVLDKLYPVEEGMGDRAVKNRNVAKEAILSIFNGHGVRGDTTGNAPGTKWCAANAIAEYTDYGRKMTKRGNQVARSFDDNAIKQRGFELVLAA